MYTCDTLDEDMCGTKTKDMKLKTIRIEKE